MKDLTEPQSLVERLASQAQAEIDIDAAFVERGGPASDPLTIEVDAHDLLALTARIAALESEVAQCLGHKTKIALTLRVAELEEALRVHAELDESMDPCDGNPCPLRAALGPTDTASEGRSE